MSQGANAMSAGVHTQVQVFALSPIQEGRDILGGVDTNPDTDLSSPLIWAGAGHWTVGV